MWEIEECLKAGYSFDDAWVAAEFRYRSLPSIEKVSLVSVIEDYSECLEFKLLMLNLKFRNLLRQLPFIWRFV